MVFKHCIIGNSLYGSENDSKFKDAELENIINNKSDLNGELNVVINSEDGK